MIKENIKTKQLQARKDRDHGVSGILTTIIGEAEMIGKNAGRESTSEDYLVTLKKFEKNLAETINLMMTKNISTDPRKEQYQKELEIVRYFMPAKLTDEKVEKDIRFVISDLMLPLEQKSLGQITKALKIFYGDQFDGKQISILFKKVIQ